jgi:hypothetical protein
VEKPLNCDKATVPLRNLLVDRKTRTNRNESMTFPHAIIVMSTALLAAKPFRMTRSIDQHKRQATDWLTDG